MRPGEENRGTRGEERFETATSAGKLGTEGHRLALDTSGAELQRLTALDQQEVVAHGTRHAGDLHWPLFL